MRACRKFSYANRCGGLVNCVWERAQVYEGVMDACGCYIHMIGTPSSEVSGMPSVTRLKNIIRESIIVNSAKEKNTFTLNFINLVEMVSWAG